LIKEIIDVYSEAKLIKQDLTEEEQKDSKHSFKMDYAPLIKAVDAQKLTP